MGSGAHGFTNVKSNPTHAHMHSYRHTHSHTHTYTRTHTHTHARTPDSAVKQQPPIGCVRQRAQEPFPLPLPHCLTHLATHSASVSLSLCMPLCRSFSFAALPLAASTLAPAPQLASTCALAPAWLCQQFCVRFRYSSTPHPPLPYLPSILPLSWLFLLSAFLRMKLYVRHIPV